MKRINFIKNIEQDEIRSGFLVTTDRKKIWQKEMEILQIVDSICDKYGIQYYIDGGTLLGAVRHGGFIPWDDDIDLVMLRPDYNRFQEIAIKEVVYPYFFRSNYTDKRILPMCKVVDERTSAIEYVDDFELHQGIFVDIFPVDVAEDGSEYNREIIRQANELWSMIVSPQYLVEQIENGNYISAERLSSGTVDQLYLSLRLAILDSMSEEKIPIILDEAFSHFDDKRLENILQYINNKFGDRQLIIFTCNRREEQALKNLKIKYNLINL